MAMPLSIIAPDAFKKFALWACLGVGLKPKTSALICLVLGPEMRTMPIPPRPVAVAIAQIVSEVLGDMSDQPAVASY